MQAQRLAKFVPASGNTPKDASGAEIQDFYPRIILLAARAAYMNDCCVESCCILRFLLSSAMHGASATGTAAPATCVHKLIVRRSGSIELSTISLMRCVGTGLLLVRSLQKLLGVPELCANDVLAQVDPEMAAALVSQALGILQQQVRVHCLHHVY